MTTLSRQPGLGQEELFSATSMEPAAQLSAMDELQPPEVPGIAVSVAERAHELGEVFKALNAASSSRGLQAAVHTPQRQRIEQRYGGSKTEQVVAGARRSEERHIVESKKHFAHAAGLYGMIGAGMEPLEATQLVRDEYKIFAEKFGVGVTAAVVRNRTARNIKKSASAITGHAIE